MFIIILQPLRSSCACVALGCVYSFSENDKNIGDGRQFQQQQHAIITSCVRLMHSLQCSIGVGGAGAEPLPQSNGGFLKMCFIHYDFDFLQR